MSSKRAFDKKVIGLVSSNSGNHDHGAAQAGQIINGILAYKKAKSFIVPRITIIDFNDIDRERIRGFIENCVGYAQLNK